MRRRSPLPEPSLVFRRLFNRFGAQGWWPVAPRGYRPGVWGRLSEDQRFEVCAGAILTQNTNWGNVQKALDNLRPLSLDSVSSTPVRKLARFIRPSGYFNQKAKKLKAFVRHARRPLRRWLSGPLAALRGELLGLYGVGPETADSILLYAGGRPSFVVDAYTLRIGSRLGWFGAGAKYEDVRAFFMDRLPAEPELYGEFHALLVELAKAHCRKKPQCSECPLLEVCDHGQRDIDAPRARA